MNIYWEDWNQRFHRYYNFTYTLIEYCTFTYLVAINIRNKRAKVAIIIGSALFIGFLYLFNFIYIPQRIDSIPIAVETVILLIIGIYFFYEQFTNNSSTYLYSQFGFWLTIGIWIYLCGSLFIYLYGEHLTTPEKEQFWFLTYIFEIVKNIMFCVAIVVNARQTIIKPPKSDVRYLDIGEFKVK